MRRGTSLFTEGASALLGDKFSKSGLAAVSFLLGKDTLDSRQIVCLKSTILGNFNHRHFIYRCILKCSRRRRACSQVPDLNRLHRFKCVCIGGLKVPRCLNNRVAVGISFTHVFITRDFKIGFQLCTQLDLRLHSGPLLHMATLVLV